MHVPPDINTFFNSHIESGKKLIVFFGGSDATGIRLPTVNFLKKVLDIGTASGDFLYYMPEEIYGFGVDISKELIDVAQETRNKPNLSFGCVDILTQPIEGHFDAITILGTLLI